MRTRFQIKYPKKREKKFTSILLDVNGLFYVNFSFVLFMYVKRSKNKGRNFLSDLFMCAHSIGAQTEIRNEEEYIHWHFE